MDPLVKPLSVHNAIGVDPLITIEETVNAIRAYTHYRWTVQRLLRIARPQVHNLNLVEARSSKGT